MRRNDNEPSMPIGKSIASEITGVSRNRPWQLYAVGAVLVVMTLMAFWGTQHNSFVSLDDDIYVTNNARVQSGLSLENVKWAFSTTYFGYYYPLTWLSHMLDCQLFGTWAGGHHLTSLIIHILNVLLLFAVLMRMTGFMWRSFSVAALFAVHPLHVESVAWVAERKDVLSTFFWFLCLLAYAWYVENPSFRRYSLIFVSFLLGLMSKPMIITLPFVLLLLDYWPLERWSPFKGGVQAGKGTNQAVTLPRLIREKIPLFALIPVFSFLTVFAQKEAKAVASFDFLPMGQRIANALISYAAYLGKMLFPVRLSAYYPLPQAGVSMLLAFLCGLFLVVLTVAALWYGREKRYLSVGWLWYLGTLVPVIGIVQVGMQAMADRYTYVPLVGVFMAAVWLLAELIEKTRLTLKIVVPAGAAILAALVTLSNIQVRCWTNTFTLFEHAISVTPDSWFAHNNLGLSMYHEGRVQEAISHLSEAIRLNPDNADAYYNLGLALDAVGQDAAAIERYEEALKLRPDSVDILNNLGLALMKKNLLPEAIERFREAVRIDPDSYRPHSNLGSALSQAGQVDAAIEEYEEAARLSNRSASSLNNLGRVLARAGRMPEAIELLQEAVRAEPDLYEARNNLGNAYSASGQLDAAIEQYKEALRIDPGAVQALNNLGLVLAKTGRTSEAVEKFQEALRRAPDFADAYICLGVVLYKEGRMEEAASQFRQALNIKPDSELARANLENAERVLRAKTKNKQAGR